jgi:chromosome segregation ATPase
VHALETQAGFASRDKDAAVEALAALQKENDALALQQSHWDDLRRTNEQLEQLAALVSQTQTQTNNNESELKELRRVRDRSKALEGEYAALQRRVASSDRTASTTRASLAQAQQRAAEWEQRANESEAALEEAQALRDEAEDRAAQIEADHALVRMQLEEKDAEERLAKVRLSPYRAAVFLN